MLQKDLKSMLKIFFLRSHNEDFLTKLLSHALVVNNISRELSDFEVCVIVLFNGYFDGPTKCQIFSTEFLFVCLLFFASYFETIGTKNNNNKNKRNVFKGTVIFTRHEHCYIFRHSLAQNLAQKNNCTLGYLLLIFFSFLYVQNDKTSMHSMSNTGWV